ncbi:MAG TPA: hypothetical protein VEU33_19145 [Archangium sp.]|nr:hypothetical protein [Archangium sp.]
MRVLSLVAAIAVLLACMKASAQEPDLESAGASPSIAADAPPPEQAPLLPPEPAEVASTFVPAERQARDPVDPDAPTSLPGMFAEIDAQSYAPVGEELSTLQITGALVGPGNERMVAKSLRGSKERAPRRFIRLKIGGRHSIRLPAPAMSTLRRLPSQTQVDVIYKAEGDAGAPPDEQVTILRNQRPLVDTATRQGAVPQELELSGVKIRQGSEHQLIEESRVVRHHRVRVLVRWGEQERALETGENAQVTVQGRPYRVTINESVFLESLGNAALETEPYRLTATIAAE